MTMSDAALLPFLTTRAHDPGVAFFSLPDVSGGSRARGLRGKNARYIYRGDTGVAVRRIQKPQRSPIGTAMTRPMNPRLDAALNSLSALDWRVLGKTVAEMQPDKWLTRVLAGLHAQHLSDQFREARALQAMAGEERRRLDELEAAATWPARDEVPRTQTLFFDPDTNESRIAE
jgi:hypothetical protein